MFIYDLEDILFVVFVLVIGLLPLVAWIGDCIDAWRKA
jgi:hypothetical protein